MSERKLLKALMYKVKQGYFQTNWIEFRLNDKDNSEDYEKVDKEYSKVIREWLENE